MTSNERGSLAGRFLALVERSRDILVLIDPHGRVEYANGALEQLLGYRPHRIVDRSVFALLGDSDMTALSEAVYRVVIDGVKSERIEQSGRDRNGRMRHFDIVVEHADLEGHDRVIVLTAQDVTEHHEAEARLRSSEELYRTIFESGAQGVTVVQDGRVVVANQAAADVIGLRLSELMQLTPDGLFGLVHRDDVRAVRQFWAAIDATPDRPRRTRYRYQRRDGGVRWVEVSVRSGTHLGAPAIYVVSLDVTETRSAQEALAMERDFVSAVLDTVGAMIVVVDRTGHIVGWNAACEAVTGFADSDAVGSDFVSLVVVEEERARMAAVLEAARAGAAGEQLLTRFRTRGGELRTVEWRNSVMRDPKGEVEFVIGTALDVSERATAERELRAVEGQLRQAQKMEAIGQLTGGIAHDFNNLLTAILGAAELAKDSVHEDPESVRRDLEEITREARRGARLVSKLMAFSRHETLERTVVDVAAICTDVGRTLMRLLPESVAIEIATLGTSFPVFADRGAVEQVLVNLATNARDAMPDGGVLRFTVREAMHVGANALGEPDVGGPLLPHVVVEVSDHGVGMDEATLARVFEPFFTTKPMGRGTGLGLSTVYGLVKQHRGLIEVESEVGRGTTFRLYFARHHRAAEPVLEATREPVSRPLGGSILVVEDDSTIRRSVKRILERAGYDVELASDGQEALELFEGGAAFDLVVSDVIMPRLSGPKLFETLRARGNETPFLFTSGYPAGEMDRMENGPAEVAVLRKPWTAANLLERVREAVAAAQ